MPGAAEVSVSEHLSKIPAAVRPTVKAARQLVRTVAPKAAEISYRSEPPRSGRAMDRYNGTKYSDSRSAARRAGSVANETTHELNRNTKHVTELGPKSNHNVSYTSLVKHSRPRVDQPGDAIRRTFYRLRPGAP